METLLSTEVISTIVVVVLGIVGHFVTSAVRRRHIALATYHAYHITKTLGEEIPGKDPAEWVSKVLERANDYMVANGWRPLKDGEKPVVELEAKSLEGRAQAAKEAIKEALQASPQ